MVIKKRKIKADSSLSIRQAMITGQELLKRKQSSKAELKSYIQFAITTFENIDKLI